MRTQYCSEHEKRDTGDTGLVNQHERGCFCSLARAKHTAWTGSGSHVIRHVGMWHGVTGGPMGLEPGGTAIQSATLGHTEGIADRVKWHQQATPDIGTASQEICRPL